MVGVDPATLRYWESEFEVLRPAKNSAGQRIYDDSDVELIMRIKALLYDNGFTIAGARKRLSGRTGPNLRASKGRPGREQQLMFRIQKARRLASEILELVNRHLRTE